MTRVALVVPNFRWSNTNPDFLWDYIPYNLCLLGANIKSIAEVKIIDAYKENLSTSSLYTRLAMFSPDVVGITTMIDQHLESGLRVAKIAKTLSLNIKVIMGGASVSVNSEEIIKDPSVDIALRGEGEFIMHSLIEKASPPGIYEATIGDCYRDSQLPDYSLIDLKSYISNPPIRKSVDTPRAYPYGRVVTSRGCPYGCCFCQVESIMGKKWRGRSVTNVLDEIAWMKKDYGVKSIVFDDDNMLYDMDRAKDIFRGMIRQKLSMPWSMIATSVIKLDSEMIELMAISGCKYVDLAVESGVERILKEIIHKPIDLDDAIMIAEELKLHNIFVSANFIIGFPGETWEEIRETLDYASEFPADYIKIFAATPLTHTKLWDMCIKSKCLKPGDAWSQGQIETDEFTAKDITILRAYEWDRINFGDIIREAKIAGMMKVDMKELTKIRKKTRGRIK